LSRLRKEIERHIHLTPFLPVTVDFAPAVVNVAEKWRRRAGFFPYDADRRINGSSGDFGRCGF